MGWAMGRVEDNGNGNGAQLLALSPVQNGYLVNHDEIRPIRLFGLQVNPATLQASYIGTFSESVGVLHRFAGETVTWSEGAALRVRALRAKAMRTAREQTAEQSDEAIAFTEAL